jgi:hypothetical protein
MIKIKILQFGTVTVKWRRRRRRRKKIWMRHQLRYLNAYCKVLGVYAVIWGVFTYNLL